MCTTAVSSSSGLALSRLLGDVAGCPRRLFHARVSRAQRLPHSSQVSNIPRLTPQEVSTVLRANEFSYEFANPGSVKSYDTNQLASNNPIEDTRAEGHLLLNNGFLAGVFDGHAGPACAQVVAKRLLKYIAAQFLAQADLAKVKQSLDKKEISLLEKYNDRYEFVHELKRIYTQSFQEYLDSLDQGTGVGGSEVKDIMESSFLRLDDDLSREALIQVDGQLDKRTMTVAMSGAVACVTHISDADLHVANVGDCQAVLGVLSDTNTWQAKKLSVEHNTDNLEEVDRILSEHPSNERDTVIKVERLLGQLAPLRAFGDFRYKWSKETLEKYAVEKFGKHVIAPNYYTPPYLTARPEVTYHRLTPRDKFLVIASDGLWDLVSPLQVVRMVGEHMSGKAALTPLRLPRKNMKLSEIANLLYQRKDGLNKIPVDRNAATHLIRNALGGTEYGLDHSKISHLLSLPQEVVRLFRDDITVTVIYFDSEFITHCPM